MEFTHSYTPPESGDSNPFSSHRHTLSQLLFLIQAPLFHFTLRLPNLAPLLIKMSTYRATSEDTYEGKEGCEETPSEASPWFGGLRVNGVLRVDSPQPQPDGTKNKDPFPP